MNAARPSLPSARLGLAALLLVAAACSGGETEGKTLSSIALSGEGALRVTGTLKLAAKATYSDGSSADVTEQATWGSAAEAIATVSNEAGARGTVTGVAVGDAEVSAAFGGKTATVKLTVTTPVLLAIGITPATPGIAKGHTLALVATGTYEGDTKNAITADVTWSSSDEAIATVSNEGASKGTVTATGVGEATLTARLGEISGTVTFKVTAAVLEAVEVESGTISTAKGLSAALKAFGRFSDGTRPEITEDVEWTSSDETIVAVSNTNGTRGNALALKVGEATVRANKGELEASVAFTVTAAEIVSIRVEAAQTELPKGLSSPLTVTATLTDGTEADVTADATFEIASGTAVTVSEENTVQAASEGVSTIKATVNGVSAEVDITVTPSALQSITLTAPAASLPLGATLQLSAEGTYSDGATRDITADAVWWSSESAFAQVSNAAGSSGLVSGLRAGTTVTITAQLAGVRGTFDLAIAPAAVVSAALSKTSLTLAAGRSDSLVLMATLTDGTTASLTDTAVWMSSDDSVATVANVGFAKVTAKKVGTATITATYGTLVKTAEVTVTAPELTKITLSAATLIAPGEFTDVVVTGTYSDGTTAPITTGVLFSSSDETSAVVTTGGSNPGRVTGIADGGAIITARVGNVSATIAITVFFLGE